jgi:hypothetical protein
LPPIRAAFLFLPTNLQRKTTVNLATKEEIIAAIQRCASRLGRAPVYHELRLELKVTDRWIQRQFGSYTKALAACGLRPTPRNAKAPLDALFRDWAEVTRKLGKIPTRNEQDSYGQFTSAPLLRRFRLWTSVPRELRRYAEKHGLWSEWSDVLEILDRDKHAKRAAQAEERFGNRVADARNAALEEDWSLPDAPSYGPPIVSPALSHGPTNEMGVMILFGSLACELGYKILMVRAGFPDCETMRRVHGDRWQRVRVEFEFESRNFREHEHDPDGCDLIVCWNHNWPECPVRVLELKKFVTQR